MVRLLRNRLAEVLVCGLLLLDLGAPASLAAQTSSSPNSAVITIDATAAGHPLPHFWEQMLSR
jgi:hypothetical protein